MGQHSLLSIFYAAGFITKAYYGAQVTKVAKATSTFENIEDFVTSTRASRLALKVKEPYDRGKARVAVGLARGGKKATGPVLHRAKSAGATYRLWKLSRKGDVDTSDLSKTERDRVTDYLARHGDEGATTLRWMDNEDFDALFKKACSSGFGIQRVGGGGCTNLNDREQRVYSDAVVAADVDPSEFGTRLAKTDVSTANARRAFVHTSRHGVEMASELDDKALNQFVQLDAGSQRLLVEAWRVDREVSGGRLGSDGLSIMVRQGADARDLSRTSGLSTKEVRKLLRAYGSSSELDDGPLDEADDLQSTLDELAEDDVDGFDDAVGDISGTKSGYKGIAGEADIADGLKDGNNDIGAADIQMEVDIEANELPEKARKSNEFKAGTDIDVKVDGELTVNGKTMDSPAIESKNIGSSLPPDLREIRQIEPLKKKLRSIAASGEDEIVVVTRKKYLDELSDETRKQIESDVNEALGKIEATQAPDEVDIEFTTFDKISE